MGSHDYGPGYCCSEYLCRCHLDIVPEIFQPIVPGDPFILINKPYFFITGTFLGSDLCERFLFPHFCQYLCYIHSINTSIFRQFFLLLPLSDCRLCFFNASFDLYNKFDISVNPKIAKVRYIFCWLITVNQKDFGYVSWYVRWCLAFLCRYVLNRMQPQF